LEEHEILKDSEVLEELEELDGIHYVKILARE